MERTPQILGADGKPLSPEREGYGGYALPPAWAYQSLYQGADKTHLHDRWDEAVKHSRADALVMMHDPFLMGLLQERKLSVASLKWHLEVPDEHDPEQAEVADTLTQSVRATPHLQNLLMSLLDALWWGRAGVQVQWGWRDVSVKKAGPASPFARPAPGKPPAGSSPDGLPSDPQGTGDSLPPAAAPVQKRRALVVRQHTPVHGDKIGHRFDGTPYVLVNAAHSSQLPRADVVLTTAGRGLLLSGSWRERFLLHRHVAEDTDFFLEADQSEALYGRGLRHVIFWLNFLRLEYEEWATTYMERVGLGLTLWLYDASNPQALAEAQQSAKDNSRKSNLFVPVWPGRSGQMQGGVERVETPTAGVEALRSMIERIEEKIERFVVGQTLSSDTEGSGLGGTGVADLHAATKHKITSFDANNLADSLTQDWVRVALRWTYADRPDLWDLPVRWVFDLDSVDPAKQLEAVATAAGLGVTFKAQEVRGLTGLSDPADGDEVVGGKQAPAPGDGPPGGDDPSGGDDDEDGGGDEPFPFRRDPARYAKDSGDGRWVTIGGHKGEGGTRRGGSPVYIQGGRITKGAPGLTGKKVDALKEEGDPGTHREQLHREKGYRRAVHAKRARKEGIQGAHLHQLAAEIVAHDREHTADRTALLRGVRSHAGKLGVNLNTLAARNARGIDSDQVKHLDELAESAALAHPEQFAGHPDAQERLFELLLAGNPEPMSEDDAYGQALEQLREMKAAGKDAPAAAEEEEPIPFAKDGQPFRPDGPGADAA